MTKSRKNGLKFVTGNTMICAWKRCYPLSTFLQKWENTGNLPTGVCRDQSVLVKCLLQNMQGILLRKLFMDNTLFPNFSH